RDRIRSTRRRKAGPPRRWRLASISSWDHRDGRDWAGRLSAGLALATQRSWFGVLTRWIRRRIWSHRSQDYDNPPLTRFKKTLIPPGNQLAPKVFGLLAALLSASRKPERAQKRRKKVLEKHDGSLRRHERQRDGNGRAVELSGQYRPEYFEFRHGRLQGGRHAVLHPRRSGGGRRGFGRRRPVRHACRRFPARHAGKHHVFHRSRHQRQRLFRRFQFRRP